MRTLNSIAHEIKDRLSGGNASQDIQLDERDIVIRIREKLNELLRLTNFENTKSGDRNGMLLYVATYADREVKEDEEQKHVYCELPENFVNLPHTKGIHSVHPKGSPDEVLVRSNNNYVSRHLPVSHMELKPSYFLEGNRIIFRKKNFKHNSWKNMVIKLIVAAPESYGLNDPLPVYSDQVGVIVDQLTQYFSAPTIQDTLNDGNKDRGVNINGKE